MLKLVKRLVVCLSLFLVLSVAGFTIYINTKYIPPVLMYHHLQDSSIVNYNKLYIRPRTFDRQMQFLRDKDYNIITLEGLAKYLRGGEDIPRNTVAVTFDDGGVDNYLYAFPILKKYSIPATMFIVTERIGKYGFVNREQIIEMSESGLITIGSHSVSHRYLPEINNKEEIRDEIYASKKKLESVIGRPVNCFSYPIGGFDKFIRKTVADAGYTVAVTTNPGLRYPNNDPFAIKRVKISESSRNLFIFWFQSSGFYKHLLESKKERFYD